MLHLTRNMYNANSFIYSMVKKDLVSDTLLQTTWFFHAGGFFFAPFNEGLYNGFKIVFMNFNETMTTDSLLPIIHEHRPWTIICSSHHAVQLATITNYSKFDLSSVRIIKPFGAAIYTGKPLSEAFIFAATNPQYVKRLFIELRVQYMKTTNSEHVVFTNCFLISEQFMYTTCSELVVFMY